MTFAVCLQVPNHIRFKRPIDIYANFIPQMIFLQSIFGYLVVCILFKWSIDWETATIDGTPVTVGSDGVIDLDDNLNGKTSQLKATVRVTFDAEATNGQNASFDLAEQGAVKVEQYR